MIDNFLYHVGYAIFTIGALLILLSFGNLLWLTDINKRILKAGNIILITVLLCYGTFWILNSKSEKRIIYQLTTYKRAPELIAFLKNYPKSESQEQIRILLYQELKPEIQRIIKDKNNMELKILISDLFSVEKNDSLISILDIELYPLFESYKNERKVGLIGNIKTLLMEQDTIFPTFSINIYYNLFHCPDYVFDRVNDYKGSFNSRLISSLFPIMPELTNNYNGPPYNNLALQIRFDVESSGEVKYNYWKSGNGNFSSGSTSRESYYFKNIILSLYMPHSHVPFKNYFINRISPEISENNPPDVYLPLSELDTCIWKIMQDEIQPETNFKTVSQILYSDFNKDFNRNIGNDFIKDGAIFTDSLSNGIKFRRDHPLFCLHEGVHFANIKYRVSSLNGFTYKNSLTDDKKEVFEIKSMGCLSDAVVKMCDGSTWRYFVPPDSDLGIIGEKLDLPKHYAYIIDIMLVDIK